MQINVRLFRSESSTEPFARFGLRLIMPPDVIVWGSEAFQFQRSVGADADYCQASTHVLDLPPLKTRKSA